MPADHKVSVAWQIVFTFIPILNWWAFYRIRKLQKYLLCVVLPSIVTSIALYAYLLAPPGYTSWGDDGIAFGTQPPVDAIILGNVIGWGLQGLAIYLVVIWSREHNKQFDQPTTQVT
jgi:hypothetical protein